MTRQNKFIILAVYLLILLLVMLAYRSGRAAKITRLNEELTRITAEQKSNRSAEAEVATLSRLMPATADSPAFIEFLYHIARESGLKEHEVTSDAGKSTGTARPGGNETKETVSKHILRIRTAGSYRSFAEYVRRLQNSERFFRITEFKLSPDTAQLKGALTVELYYLPVKQ